MISFHLIKKKIDEHELDPTRYSCDWAVNDVLYLFDKEIVMKVLEKKQELITGLAQNLPAGNAV